MNSQKYLITDMWNLYKSLSVWQETGDKEEK